MVKVQFYVSGADPGVVFVVDNFSFKQTASGQTTSQQAIANVRKNDLEVKVQATRDLKNVIIKVYQLFIGCMW